MKQSPAADLLAIATRAFIVSLALAWTLHAADAPRQLRAGAAASNITPPLGAGIVGSGTSDPPSVHIHDELWARCLVLDNGVTRLAIVVCDNLHATRPVYDLAKEFIAKETGLPADHVLISATHTHSGPSAMGKYAFTWGTPLEDYQKFMARRIADGVRRALNNLAPARIGWGAGSVPQHVFNRRWHMKPGTPLPNPVGGQDRVLMNPGVNNPNLVEPAGPVDPQVSFVSVQSTNGRPIALLANYSLHYVGGVGQLHISADYYGMFCDRIQQLLGADRLDPPFVGLMSNGTSGDVNNINVRPEKPERRAPYEQMRLVANDVAAEVARVHKTVQFHDWVPLAAAMSELELAVRKPTPAMVERARVVLAAPDKVKLVHRRETDYAGRLVALVDWPEKISVPLQALRLGDLGIATSPFETFAETGLEIKQRSPFKATFTIELANGWMSYLATPRQHALGGYETWHGTGLVETDASVKMVDALMKLLNRLK
ncbi:MAG: neutral/alkaline non-lysosomal ceramidase N-terminal domain-containing protein [Verrucomicrobia bacterium]|nr:neutral/alkaline non-lysosomal ceramidase N-terminal domain-containing protein [Verrucomicrobiota bacterium]